MPTKTWKDRERQVARFFGAKGRTPLSGGNSGHTRSDTMHEKLFIEHKHRQHHSLVTLWRQVARFAKREGKLPVVSISEHGRNGFWLLIHSGDLKQVAMEQVDDEG